MIRVYWGGQKVGALAQAWVAELVPPAMLQLGKGLPRARSRQSWVIGGTHCGIARQLGAARQSKTRHPSSATAVVLMLSSAAASRTLAMRVCLRGASRASALDACGSAEAVWAFMATGVGGGGGLLVGSASALA